VREEVPEVAEDQGAVADSEVDVDVVADEAFKEDLYIKLEI
jgi:hypothetical protein